MHCVKTATPSRHAYSVALVRLGVGGGGNVVGAGGALEGLGSGQVGVAGGGVHTLLQQNRCKNECTPAYLSRSESLVNILFEDGGKLRPDLHHQQHHFPHSFVLNLRLSANFHGPTILCPARLGQPRNSSRPFLPSTTLTPLPSAAVAQGNAPPPACGEETDRIVPCGLPSNIRLFVVEVF
jgi:hypothetical protein